MIGKILYYVNCGVSKLIRKYQISLFANHGDNVYIGKNCTITYKSVWLGDSVYIGNNCVIQSAHGKIKIGNHVMFGPGVNVHGGNHLIDRVGVYMDQIHKESGCDRDVLIEDDVWIGANVLILNDGITIGKGSVIGAGSIVTKSVPPYSVAVGNPAHVIKKRFSDEQIKQHEAILKNK